MERLIAEVKIREREDLRSVLGSDYDSDEEPEDVTNPKNTTTKNFKFQDENTQQFQMRNILHSFTQVPAKAQVTKELEVEAVSTWLRNSVHESKYDAPIESLYPSNDARAGYIPPTDASGKLPRQPIEAASGPQNRHHDMKSESSSRRTNNTTSVQGQTEAALFSRVLQENRLPKPKMMSFDGDPKRYKLFMASFRNNVEARLDGDDQLKLTLLLDQCTGEAFELIEECVMLKPDEGYRTAIEKLERRFGKSHLIARSYIDGVKKGESINPNDVKALVKLADDMRKCQNVLTELRFASDLDSTGTIESILDRLPESLQNQWIKKSSKILNMGREPTFQDLTMFVEERADDVNSKYGQYIAEKRSAVSTNPKPHDQFNKSQDTNKSRSHERQRSQPVTTLSTEVHSTAGPDVKQNCAHCVREGHVIWRCFKFK